MQYAIENGIIDLQRVQQQIEMNKRKKILDAHPYSLLYNEKKGRWYTRFVDGEKVIQRNRKTREELEDLVIEYYTREVEEPEEIYSFTQAHDRWMSVQEEYGKDDNTIYRYEYDWKRYFEGTEFSKKNILTMTSQDIETFIIKRIRDLSLKRQAGVTLYGYITGVFYSAVMDRKIAKDDNPCDYVDRKKFMKFYNKSKKTPEERVLSQEELASLVEKLNSEVRDDPQKLMPYGVRLSLLTGMRRGEICGLRWRNVFQDRMLICEAEKYNQKEGKYYLSDTKTGKERSLPITSELDNFLNEMRKLQAQYGITDDFVISTGTGKLRTNSLSNYMLRLSHKLNFNVTKNIHTIRRTFNSYMRQSGTNAIMAGSIIGNSAEVNDNHYTYDICDMTTKNQLVTDIEKKMLTNCSFG